MMKAIRRHKSVTWFKIFQDYCLCVFLVNVDLICKSCKQVPILVLARTVINPKNKIIDVSIASNETYVRTGNIWSISSFDTSCQRTPVCFLSFPIFGPPTGAKVLLRSTIHLQKTTSFSPGILGNIFTFCISTETTVSLSFHFCIASSLYLDLASLAVLICISNS